MTKKSPQNTNFTIRNSTAEFLMFTVDSCVDNISFHLKNIVKDNELDKNSVIKEFSVTASDLDLAEERAKRKIPMTMEDWSKRLDKFLEFDDRNILKNKGSISHEEAKQFAETQWEQYRILQDKLFESDFDNEIKKKLQDNP
jgi:hypothetical protein